MTYDPDEIARLLRAANDRVEEAHALAREALGQRDATAIRARAYVAEIARLRGILAAGRDGWRETPPDADAIRDHAAAHPAHDEGDPPAGRWLVVDATDGAPDVAAVLLFVVDGVRWLHCNPFGEGVTEFCLVDPDESGWTWRPLTAHGEVVT